MSRKKVIAICPKCGQERYVMLGSGQTLNLCRSCSKKAPSEEYIGKTFGKLTVLSDAEPSVRRSGKKDPRILCECVCGNVVTLRKNHVMSGATVSCGCREEKLKEKAAREAYLESIKPPPKEKAAIDFERGRCEYMRWASKIKKVGRCVVCGSSQNLAAHHLESYKENPELRTAPENGVCLCANCHVEYHTGFMGGYHVPATTASFDVFMRMKNGEVE